ncbi:hypothetical protein BASA50_000972 [Batrachochytrium salamandrivorans]|uniref:RNA-binding S4 domain-containing protein n=1 Tax=Batrachochytrium salamandrivorans TaxID=1357716 RepID=A0ABQ8ESW1_9FUNG|nr:hypothetical protein BASA60_001578 [Batrachochytrium salamandrivorans]KAH6585811.1 hypothetical protein BASA50_000972 [Batrachochytrium salamandrivorans]KAH6591528.1 hypothetical protein BASA61_004905 [Batrachochytrium salamandrivorans]KAJ1341879.1 hypothetical protein BSLG_003532 [Batrachochytrium salamandrivorans]
MPRRILSIVPKDAFSKTRGLIRMSWDKRNLENLVDRRTPQDLSKMTVFQQKWVSKRELRGYHVSNITERQFLNRHFDPMLPNRQLSPKEKNEIPPIQALAFGELERRSDVVVFRSHFADSIWKARLMIVRGQVKVNGEKCRYPARRLQDGDMITVAPRSIPTLAGKTDATLRFKPFPYMSPWMFTPAYLEVDYTTCSTVFLRSPVAQPNAVEIPSPLPPTFHQLAFEWYAPIKRARKVLPRDPLIVCGQTVKLKPKFDSIMRMDQKNRLTELRNKIAAKREKRSAERHLRAEEKQGEETSA